ncbi:MAG: SGNH/GDSL hydrolase family protein [Fimbriimonas sp.]
MRAPFVFAALTLLAAAAPAQFAVRDGDRVAFYGDSITDNGVYTTLVETYVVTRYPKWNVRFFNAGVGGDRVSGGWMGPIDERLSRDLFARKPTLVTVMLGMNDAGYRDFQQPLLDNFNKGYRHILDEFKKEIPKARVWLIKPSPYDDVTRPSTIAGGYNSVLLRYSESVGQMAKEYGHWLVDFNYPVSDALYRAYSLNATESARLIPDRVHPSNPGHLIMAAALLKAWNAPKSTAEVGIDVPSGAVTAKASSVTGLKRGDTVEWTQLDEYLPFPIDRKDPLTALAASSAPVVDEVLAGQILRLTGLKAPSYALTIDGEPVGTFTSAELATGVDLTKRETPMSKQAAEVHVLTTRRATMKWALWRNVEFGLQRMPSKERDEAVAAFGRLEEDVIRRQKAMAKPRPRKFVLTPAG